MNDIILRGLIRDILPSHKINETEYEKANLIVKNGNREDDVISLCFKKFTCNCREDDEIYIVGKIRSFSRLLDDNKNKVSIYVYTYFDAPEENIENDNLVKLDGRICKLSELHTTQNGKQNLHFILANNIFLENEGKKINSYLPCVAWGRLAQLISEYEISDKIKITGSLHSRTYKKTLDDGNIEIRVAHEILIDSVEKED